MTITLETAERLIANYPNDAGDQGHHRERRHLPGPGQQPGRRELLLLQLRVAAEEHDQPLPGRATPTRAAATSWGVDLNRNYRVGVGLRRLLRRVDELHRRHVPGPGGAVRAGDARTRSGSSRTYRNIKFFMSVHSNGGQLFWQPGAYIADGRITTPRPPLGHESFYWQSADRILSQVRAHRQTVVTPENVGGSSDVLYSSAGNVREDMYFNYGIFAFGWEVGGSVYNPATGNFQGGSFQPPWVGNAGPRQRPQRDDGVHQRRHGDVPDRRATSAGTRPARRPRSRPAGTPVGLADRREVRHQRAGDRLLHDGRLARRRCSRRATSRPSSASRARRCGSRRPRRSSGSRSTPRATSSRRLRPGQPGDAGQLPHRHDQHRREPLRRRHGAGHAEPLARHRRRPSRRSSPGVGQDYRRRRRPTSSPPPATRRCPSRRARHT